MKIQIKKLKKSAKLPFQATTGSAGADLYACIEQPIIVLPGGRVSIPTGLAMSIAKEYAIFLFPRSSIASKYGVSLSNCVGVIDSDYRGEVSVAIINNSTEAYTINPNDRIAQAIILPIPNVEYIEVETLDETARGSGGFGSTGK